MEKFSEEEIRACRSFVAGAMGEIAKADAPPEVKTRAAMEVGKFVAGMIKERARGWEVFDRRSRLRKGLGVR
jgi:hypothetical protein